MPQKDTEAMANDRDPRSDLGAWLGEELRRARLDAGFTSQDQLARELGFDRTVIVKAETGARPPSEDVALKIAEMFPRPVQRAVCQAGCYRPQIQRADSGMVRGLARPGA